MAFGCCLLSENLATAHDVLTAIDKQLHDKAAKEAVETFRKQLAEWNGPENAVSLLKEYYG